MKITGPDKVHVSTALPSKEITKTQMHTHMHSYIHGAIRRRGTETTDVMMFRHQRKDRMEMKKEELSC